MIKKVKRQVLSPVIGGRTMRQVAQKAKVTSKKAKATTIKTTAHAKRALRSVSDQVVGTKEHKKPEFSAPRITTETVAEEREEVLSKARRFIYPLQSRRRVVIVSISIILGVLISIIVVTGVLLYGFKSTSGFSYNISRFVPFPVARVDGEFISYENYLFEVRNALFYLRNYAQEGIDIDSTEGDALVKDTKTRILEKIQRDELAKQLASDAGIKISGEEIDAQVQKFEVRGGIDQSQGTLESVLAKYYDWDLGDLKRVVKLQLIYNKLLPVVDEEANKKLEYIQSRLAIGRKFAVVAENHSDDKNTSSNGGKVGTINLTDSVYDEKLVAAIFSVNEGQKTEAVVAPTGYYIFRVDKIIDEENREVSQIFVRFFDIDNYLEERLDHVAHRAYITID